MVFRRESRVDAFQRQISQLRQQLNNAPEDGDEDEYREEPEHYQYAEYADDAQYDEQVQNQPQRPSRQLAPNQDAPAYAYPNYQQVNPMPDPYIPTFDEPVQPAVPELPFLGATETSVVAQDTAFRGDMESNGSVHVQGRVEGTITAREDIYVAEDAEVEATLTGSTIIISGKVRGTLKASTRLEVLPQGNVSGEIIAPTLVVHDGAHIVGSIRMTLTDEEQARTPPARSATIVDSRPNRSGVRRS